MAIIVEHMDTCNKYILLGTGYGVYKDTRESFLGGNLFPHVDKGDIPVVAVSDGNGMIKWLSSDSVRVLEIDGIKIESFVGIHTDGQDSHSQSEEMNETCPACSTNVSENARICYSCGLTLIDDES